jgi:ABC-type uncharacterized transport system permease subunit
MKEWCKKHLGWVGFGVGVAFTLIGLLGSFILKIDYNYNLVLFGFSFMALASSIHGILNEKYFTKYSEKVKNNIIVFIVAIIIVESCLLLASL